MLSFFIIKPEALMRVDDIYRYIEKNSSLCVVDSREIVLTLDEIKQIYIDDVDSTLMSAIAKHLVGKTVVVGIVGGKNAVSLFQKICGDHYDPKRCAPGTLRHEFGLFEVRNYDGVAYFINAVHKASDAEADMAIAWYENRFSIKKGELLSRVRDSSSRNTNV